MSYLFAAGLLLLRQQAAACPQAKRTFALVHGVKPAPGVAAEAGASVARHGPRLQGWRTWT